jgi:hypothetical protein
MSLSRRRPSRSWIQPSRITPVAGRVLVGSRLRANRKIVAPVVFMNLVRPAMTSLVVILEREFD